MSREEEKARREEEEADERKRRQEQQRREERQRQEEARILREREELRRLKEREAADADKVPGNLRTLHIHHNRNGVCGSGPFSAGSLIFQEISDPRSDPT